MVKTPPNIFLNKSTRKNLAFIVAVSNPYIHELKKNWDRLSDWDICVLTDKPEEFENAFYVEEYNNAIFSYVFKFTFAIRMAIKFKRGGFILDADDMLALREEFINSEHDYSSFKTVEFWHTPRQEIKDSEFGKNLSRFTDHYHIDLLDIDPVSEQATFIPYHPKLSRVLYEIERIKPILEYTSLFNWDFTYLGHGEGIALSVALKMLNINIELLDSNPYNYEYWQNRRLF